MEYPTRVGEQIIFNCGITSKSGLDVKLDKSVLPSSRQFYSRIKRNPEGKELVVADGSSLVSHKKLRLYIVTLGKEGKNNEVLVRKIRRDRQCLKS